MYVNAPCVCSDLVHTKARRGHWNSRDWSYRHLGASLCVLGITLRSSERAESPLLTSYLWHISNTKVNNFIYQHFYIVRSIS